MIRPSIPLRASAGALLLMFSSWSHADLGLVPQGLFEVYEFNRESGVPNLVTPDLLLVSYGLIRQNQDVQVELHTLIPELKAFVSGLNAKLPAGQNGDAASLAHNYALLLQAMLAGSLPDKAPEAVSKEWKLVQGAGGIAESPLWGTQLDYSQFKPRGRYTASKDLQQYFVAYRYASTVNLFAVPSKATGVTDELALRMTHTAAYLSQLIAKDAELSRHYDKIRSTLTWEYGEPGDLGVADVEAAAKDVKDGDIKGQTLLDYARKGGRLPQVIDVPIDASKLGKDEIIAEVALGWRLLPGVQSANGIAMQTVLYPNTGDHINPCATLKCQQPWTLSLIEGKPSKGYVSAYEIMSWLGSSQGSLLVHERGDDNYDRYDTAALKAASVLRNGSGLEAAQNAFMQNALSENDPRRLNSMLGFWTWQQSINSLYTKQVMTPASKSLNLNTAEPRKGAVLAGSVYFYNSLYKLAALQADHATDGDWGEFAVIARQLSVLAQKQAGSQFTGFSDREEQFLNELDTKLLGLTKGKDAPIVVDVLTNPLDKLVVEEATGLPDIQAVGLARGAWMTHYEFKQDMSARLTNEEWRKQVR